MWQHEAESPRVSKAQEGFKESQLECAEEQREGLCQREGLLAEQVDI